MNKTLCSEKNCFKMVNTDDFIKMRDGSTHPTSELCWDCQGDSGRRRLKRYKAKLRKRENQIQYSKYMGGIKYT